MTFNELVTYPYDFFLNFLSSLEDSPIFYIVLSGLVVCGIVMLINWAIRRV